MPNSGLPVYRTSARSRNTKGLIASPMSEGLTSRVIGPCRWAKVRSAMPRGASAVGMCCRSLSMVSIVSSPLLADAVLSAVDDDCLAGDECRVVARQEQDGAGDVSGLTEPLDRLVFPGGALLRFRLRRGCGRVGQARQYRVGGNAVACDIVRQPAHESTYGFPSSSRAHRDRVTSYCSNHRNS